MWGICDSYYDGFGREHTVPKDTRAAILAAMRVDDAQADTNATVIVVRQGETAPLAKPGKLLLEEGGSREVTGSLPSDLPLGYHELTPRSGAAPIRVIVAPARCYLEDHLRTWGWAAQLPTVRSAASWGMGDLGDLRELARWSADRLHAGILMVNPLSAALPIAPQQTSPYYPSSRLFRNPLYLRIGDIPGAREACRDLEDLEKAGRALNEQPIVDRDAVFRLKMEALEALWPHFRDDARVTQYIREQGESLGRYGAFCGLAEHHQKGWGDWPREHRSPESPAVARFVSEHADRVHFHQWLQWLFDEQLAAAADGRRVMQDLPIGVDPNGADAWAWQDVFASGVSVGAPPDEFNRRGQDWGLPPFIPHKLRAADYGPFIDTLRATLRHAGGLRIDHVMGLFRLFWVPVGMEPSRGAYVRYDADELLSIVALESVRARAFIVGEDLGTLEEGVREKLAERNVLSYRLLWFESAAPANYPRLSLAAVSTHDLPTIAGLWSGADLEEQRDVGMAVNEEGTARTREHLRNLVDRPEDAAVEEVITRAHERLSEAGSMMVVASLEDALGVERRPNLPGTMNDTRPNWSIALPKPLEEIESDPLVSAVAHSLARRSNL
jgi:4-alpha-glucanotransferase